MKSNFVICTMIGILMIAVCCFASGKALADTPQDVALSYDPGTQTLTVNITHKSTFTGLHYVKQVEIRKNNQPVSRNEYKSQTGKTTFSYSYNVPANENDLLEVTAACNIQGQKTATLKVESKKN